MAFFVANFIKHTTAVNKNENRLTFITVNVYRA